MQPGTKEKFFTLSQISAGIRDAIAMQFGERLLWIVAEISDLNVRKGHCYLSLVEKLPDNPAPVCELKGIIWGNKFERISRVFREATASDMSSGTRILFQAAVKYDVKWGLSLVVEDVEPAYTVGLIKKERDQTVAKLKSEGIYYNNKQLEFPLVPLRVAVISAKDSRGYEDFQNKLVFNSYGYKFTVALFSSLLQGDRAPVEMVNRLIEIFNRKNEFDIVVIVRGGGGAIDLNCFNDFKLARAVARFPLPVLTGIGHTTNISVVDEVAHADRITPTDAADFLVDRTRRFEESLMNYGNRIHEAYIDTAVAEEDRLQILGTGIKQLTSQRLDISINQLSNFLIRFKNETFEKLKDSNTELLLMSHGLRNRTNALIAEQTQHINGKMVGLRSAPLNKLINTGLKLDQYEAGIRILDPVNVLKRGFSITKINGKTVRNKTQVRPGDSINTTLYEGTIESEIKG